MGSYPSNRRCGFVRTPRFTADGAEAFPNNRRDTGYPEIMRPLVIPFAV